MTIEKDLEIEGAWFGVEKVENHTGSIDYPAQITMFISDRYANSNSLFQDVVDFFENEFLPDRGFELDEVFLHGDLTIFYS